MVDDVFSMVLEPTSLGTERGGMLTLGSPNVQPLNESDATSNSTVPQIYYTPILAESFYIVGLYDMLLGGKSILDNSYPNGRATVVDSGTTYLLLPSPLFTSFVNVFQTNYCNLPFVCGGNSIFDLGK